MRTLALLRERSLFLRSLDDIAGAAGAGEFLLHIRLVLTLIGDKLRVIHLRKAGHARLILLLRNRLVGRETVDMVRAREEGESADYIPIFLDPIHDADPLVFRDRDGRRGVVLGEVQ